VSSFDYGHIIDASDPTDTGHFYASPPGPHIEAGWYIPVKYRMKRKFKGQGPLFVAGGFASYTITAFSGNDVTSTTCSDQKVLTMTVLGYKRVRFNLS